MNFFFCYNLSCFLFVNSHWWLVRAGGEGGGGREGDTYVSDATRFRWKREGERASWRGKEGEGRGGERRGWVSIAQLIPCTNCSYTCIHTSHYISCATRGSTYDLRAMLVQTHIYIKIRESLQNGAVEMCGGGVSYLLRTPDVRVYYIHNTYQKKKKNATGLCSRPYLQACCAPGINHIMLGPFNTLAEREDNRQGAPQTGDKEKERPAFAKNSCLHTYYEEIIDRGSVP